MRVWDLVAPARMCNPHLRGEWREIWGLWNIAQRGFTGGYANHPETRRWVGRSGAILNRMKALHQELRARGGSPKSIPNAPLLGNASAPLPWDDQLTVLKSKGCACEVP